MRDEENNASAGIKVVDKRRFTESGDIRPGGDDSSRAAEPSRPDSTSVASIANLGTNTAAAPNLKAAQVEAATASPATKDRQTDGRSAAQRSTATAPSVSSVEFSSFVVSLATQALAMLGEISHPDLQGVPINLEAARETIDIIAMLEQKTAGNLSESEVKLVTEVLSSLRLAYVRRAK
jgi:hypothetical protein